MKQRKAISIICLALITTLTGCGFTSQNIVDKETIAQKQKEIEFKKGYKTGFEAGYEQAQNDVLEYLAKYKDELIALKNYQKLVKAGVLQPPKIVAYHKPVTISKDGQSYTSEQTKLVIKSPARFKNPSALQELFGNEHIDLFDTFPDYKTAHNIAEQLQDNIQEEDKIILAPDIEKNKWSVLIYNRSGYDYRNIGVPAKIDQEYKHKYSNQKNKTKEQKPTLQPHNLSPEDIQHLEKVLRGYYQSKAASPEKIAD